MSLPIRSGRTSATLVAVAGLGFLLALAGTYWDDAWHTDRGRDAFLIGPHIALYLGITVAGSAIFLLCALKARATGMLVAAKDPRVGFAVLGLVLTLGAAPVDNAWHIAFGRDAVLWSPPHMLGVAGSLAIAISLLLFASDLRPSSWGLRWILAAAVLAVCLVPVMEYETDVPQFSLVWFLPALCFGSATAFAAISTLMPDRWAAVRTAVAYTLLRVVITAGLIIGGFSAPLVPLMMIPALTLDVARRRRWTRHATAAAYSATLFAVYVPYLNWFRTDVFLGTGDVVAGFAIALPAAWFGLWIGGQPRASSPPRPIASTSLGVLLVLLLFAPSARGHDPGQGEEAGVAEIRASVEAGTAMFSVDLNEVPGCSAIEPTELVARRAGRELSAPLYADSRCRFAGEVTLDDRGRWFLYATLGRGATDLETWIAVNSEGEREISEARPLYTPPEVSGGALKTSFGLLAYGVFAVVLALVALLVRSSLPPGTATGRTA